MEQTNQQKQLAERIASQKRITLTVQSLLDSENGRFFLKLLSEMCNENKPTYVDQNPNGTAYKEGQRSIILGIRAQLNKTFNEPEQEKEK